jgi:hypothetical protein
LKNILNIYEQLNEPTEKLSHYNYGVVFEDLLTPPQHEIVDRGAFCEVIFSSSRTKISLRTFSTGSTIKVTCAIKKLPHQAADVLGVK